VKENLCVIFSHEEFDETGYNNSLQSERQDVHIRPKLEEAKVVTDESGFETIINDGSDNDSYDDDNETFSPFRRYGTWGRQPISNGSGSRIDDKGLEDTNIFSPNHTIHKKQIKYKDATEFFHPDCVEENMVQYSARQARVRENPTETSNPPWKFDGCNQYQTILCHTWIIRENPCINLMDNWSSAIAKNLKQNFPPIGNPSCAGMEVEYNSTSFLYLKLRNNKKEHIITKEVYGCLTRAKSEKQTGFDTMKKKDW